MAEDDRSESLRDEIQVICDAYRIGIQSAVLALENGRYLVVLKVSKGGYNRVTLDPLVRRVQALNGVEQVTIDPIQ